MRRAGLWSVWGAMATAMAAVAFHPVHETDPYWHAMLGRAVLRAGSRIVPEPTALLSMSEPRVVPEWGWGILNHGLYSLWGGAAWTFGAMLLSALGALAVGALAREAARAHGLTSRWPAIWAAGLACIALVARARFRPQLVTAILLPLLLWGLVRCARSGTPGRLWIAAAFGITALWAQLHGGFVLAAALVPIAAALPIRKGDPETRQGWLLAVAATLVAILTSAHGTSILGYIQSHASSDSATHVTDMRASTWGSYDPTQAPYVLALELLWLTSAWGLSRCPTARWPVREIAWAALGIAVHLTAARFVGVAAIMAVPLATWAGTRAPEGATVSRGSAVTAAMVMVLLVLGGWSFRHIDSVFGPFGRAGVAHTEVPWGALARLRRAAPQNANILTDYKAGAPLGYLWDGQPRTYVDGRTPLHFGDVDHGVSREILGSPTGLRGGLLRYRPAGIVLERQAKVCPLATAVGRDVQLAPAVVEPLYTTFMPGARSAPRLLAACGSSFLAEHPCSPEAEKAIRRLAKRTLRGGRKAWGAVLHGVAVAQCGGNAKQALKQLEPIAWRRTAGGALSELRAVLHLRASQPERALVEFDAALDSGHFASLRWLRAGIPGADLPVEPLRRVLERATDELGDMSPPPLRAHLAMVCASAGDARCAAFHGLRAAARGQQAAVPVLEWLRDHAESERQRKDAQAWLEALTRHRTPAEAPPASH